MGVGLLRQLRMAYKLLAYILQQQGMIAATEDYKQTQVCRLISLEIGLEQSSFNQRESSSRVASANGSYCLFQSALCMPSLLNILVNSIY